MEVGAGLLKAGAHSLRLAGVGLGATGGPGTAAGAGAAGSLVLTETGAIVAPAEPQASMTASSHHAA
jgi:hypothetical protein